MSGAAFLAFGRCVGFVGRAPGFSHPSVPPAVRAGLSLALAIGVSPAVAHVRSPDGFAFVLALAAEFGIGAAIGFAASILYDGAYAGGRLLDDYVGIKSAVPNAQVFAASGFGRIWSLVFTAGFFVLGGYRYAILVFAESFARTPPGATLASRDLYAYAIALPATIVEAALLIAGPAIALVFVVQIALGALTRVIPRFGSFTLSFPLVFAAALGACVVAIPLMYGLSARPWLRVPLP